MRTLSLTANNVLRNINASTFVVLNKALNELASHRMWDKQTSRTYLLYFSININLILFVEKQNVFVYISYFVHFKRVLHGASNPLDDIRSPAVLWYNTSLITKIVNQKCHFALYRVAYFGDYKQTGKV